MRILVVDDDPDARALAARAVGGEFPEAELFQAGEPKALEALLGEPFDILVTDYMLRWSDGFAVYEKVRLISPDICCVMFTGTGNEELAVRAMKAGFDDYLVKSPNQLRRLAASLRLAYERRRERRALHDQRELLLRELYHRLHNNLQIVISLVRRTARSLSGSEDRDKLLDLTLRIQAISMLQEEFYRAERIDAVPLDVYLRRLADDLSALAPQVAFALDLDPLLVSVQHAVPLGLIANELLTNSLKHAFPDERPGSVSVTLKDGAPECVLRVSDTGIGASATRPLKSSLGMELVHGLARQIGARVEREEPAQGWSTAVVFSK